MSRDPDQILAQPFTGGMNESIDPTILPLEQLQFMQNARVRKPGSLGKRNGYFKVPTTKSAQIVPIGAAPGTTGSLSGNVCGLGDRLAIVNDTAYTFSEQKQRWRDQFAGNSATATGSGLSFFSRNANAPIGHVSGWRCARGSFPAYQEDSVNASSYNCDTEFFDGLHWVAMETFAGTSGGSPVTDVQVMALDPSTDAVVYETQIANAQNPRLFKVGATLVLLAMNGTSLQASQFVSYGAPFAGGLAAGITVSAVAVGTVVGTGGYFAIPISSTQLLVGYQDGANTIKLQLYTVSATTFTAGILTSFAPAGGPATYWLSLAYDGASAIAMAWRNSADGKVRCQFISLTLVNTSSEVAVSATAAVVGRPHCAYRTGGGQLTVIWTADTTGTSDERSTIHTASVTGAAGGSVTREMMLAPKMQLVSQAFFVGSSLYCWAAAENEASLQRYLFLLNVEEPTSSKYPVPGAGKTVYVPGFEFTAQDMLVGYSVELASATTIGAWLGKTTLGANGYIFAAPFARASQDDVSKTTAMRLLQMNHYSESVQRRAIAIASARSGQVMAGGVVSVCYSTGAYELGFMNAPGSATLVGSVGAGALTATATYFYTFVYRWVTPGGDVERSAPSATVSVTLAGAQNTVTITTDTTTTMGLYGLGAKSGVCLDVYRSSGGSVFDFIGTVDQRSGIYADVASDLTAAANGVIYVQVGLELENRPPPACRFLCVSQNRLWCGGLPNPRVIHSSKTFQLGVAISFADDDAFRVTLPDECTGLAFMDNMVAFTRTAIYIIGGDGPDNSGSNGWAAPVALPFPIGCVDWRSIIVSEEGTFFQSDRGLYMLPRGFGEPVAAGDMVMEQMRGFPVCTGAAAVTRGDLGSGASSESTIRWSFVEFDTGTGILVVYDRVHKCWSVDAISALPDFSSSYQANFIATWSDNSHLNGPGLTSATGGRMALAYQNLTVAVPIMREALPGEYANAGFGDAQPSGGAGDAISMVLRSGQMRPFGLLGHGPLQRVGLVFNARGTTTFAVSKTTDLGNKIVSGLTPQLFGATEFFEIGMSPTEGRDVNYLQLQLTETSTTEGMRFNGFALDIGETQGFRKQNILERA